MRSWAMHKSSLAGLNSPHEKNDTRFLTCRTELVVLLLPHAISGVESNGRGEMPEGSLHRPMVSVGSDEQGVSG